MRDDGGEGGHSEKAQPAALFNPPGPEGKDDGEDAHEFRHHAVGVFVPYAANHVRHFVKGAKTGWPVGDGQTGVVTGNQRSGNDEDERGAGGEDGEAVQSAVIWDFDAFQDGPREDRAWSDARSRNASVYQTIYRNGFTI